MDFGSEQGFMGPIVVIRASGILPFQTVSIEQLFDIADSGNVMPPKSTWFEPKLRDGLLTHLI